MVIAARVRGGLVDTGRFAAIGVAESQIGSLGASGVGLSQPAHRIRHGGAVDGRGIVDVGFRRGHAGVTAAGIGDAGETVQCIISVAGHRAVRIDPLDHVAIMRAACGVRVKRVGVGRSAGLRILLGSHAA